MFGNNLPEDKISFGNIAGIAPVVDFNIELLTKALGKAGIEFKQNSTDRVQKVKNWIEEYNPNKKYVLLDNPNKEYFESLSDEEKTIIKTLHNYIENNNFTEKEIQLYLYSVINDENLSKKENVTRQQQNFKNIYNLLFGRDDGPRLYLFLSAVDKSKYLDLLNF